MRYYFASTIIKTKQNNKQTDNNQVRMWRNQNTLALLMGIENGAVTLANSMAAPQMVAYRVTVTQ